MMKIATGTYCDLWVFAESEEKILNFGSWRVDGEDVLVIEEAACEMISSWAKSEHVIVNSLKSGA